MSDNSRIHVLHYGLSEHLGGIEANLKKIVDGIDLKRFQFSFIDSTRAFPCFYDELSHSGCGFYKVTPRRKSVMQNRRDINDLFRLNDIDIFHYHTNTLSYILPVEVALKHGVEVVIHSRSAGMVGSLPTRMLHRINKKRIQRLKSGVTRLAVSQQAARWMFGEGDDCHILRNGIDLSRFFYSKSSRNAIREQLGICPDTFLLGNVSSFTPAKNHKFIVRVFHQLLRSHPELKVKLCLVGDGVKKDEIISLVKELNISEYVLFLGRNSKVEEVYSALDLFLFPSLFEGFGNVMVEAQATGLVCLISDKIPRETFVDKRLIKVLEVGEGLEDTWCSWISDFCYRGGMIEGFDRNGADARVDKAGLSKEKEISYLSNLYSTLVKK